jgi:hypothetical protein
LFFFQFLFFLAYSLKNEEVDDSLIYIPVILVLIGVFIAIGKVKLSIDRTHIKYGLFPLSMRKIEFKKIVTYEIIKISAFSDFLGMGLRFSKKYGTGYITDTKYALFFEKLNGAKVTISLRNREKLVAFIKDNEITIAQGLPWEEY